MTTFTKTTLTRDPATGASSKSVATVAGDAFEKFVGDPRQYEGLGLVSKDDALLLFTPNAYGDVPEIGSTVDWAEETWTVKSVKPFRPDGVCILAYVVISR